MTQENEEASASVATENKFKILMEKKNIKKLMIPVKAKSVNFLRGGIAVTYLKTEKDLSNVLEMSEKFESRGIKLTVVKDENLCQKKAEPEKVNFQKKTVDEITEEINQTGSIFLRNLNYNCTEKDLVELFEKYGKLTNVNLITDMQTKLNKGFAILTFMFPKDAVDAFKKLDKTKFQDRLLHILPGKEKVDADVKKQEDDFLTKYKDEHFATLKSEAALTHNWNALFVNQEAVVAYLADKFQTTKQSILDSTGKKSSAVRVAHGEAQLVNEIKKFLVSSGVNLDLLNEYEQSKATKQRHKSEAKSVNTQRVLSGTIFMIKSLPYGTGEEDVLRIIGKLVPQYNEEIYKPKRIICPPLGICAIIEYESSNAARHVYKSLAYEKYKDNLLMLQWAPDKIFDNVLKVSPEKTVEPEDCTNINDVIEMPKQEDMNELYEKRKLKDAELEKCDGSTKKISNTDKQYGKKSSLKYQKRKSEQEIEPEFDIVEEPDNSKIDEVFVPLKKAKVHEVKPNNILLVRNIPFQSNIKEIKSLFKPIAGFVNARLPNKVGGGHRGFGFIEFDSIESAKIALDSLGKVTHFLGRRLLLEFAKTTTA